MKTISYAQAADHVTDGMTIMVGGFMTNGTPEGLMDALVEKGVKNLTLIANDTGYPQQGIGKLIAAGAVKKLIATHIGLNPETGQQMNSGQLDVTLVPQGTLIEQIRAGGSGLGGVLTPTGLGTEVEQGKQVIEIRGKSYILEEAVTADVALLFGSVVDAEGNVFYKGTTQNFNPMMALAASTVIVEAQEQVATGGIPQESVVTPGILVDYVVGGRI